MLPNPILMEQLARDKQAEMRRYLRRSSDRPRAARLAWLAGLMAAAVDGASLFVR
jgi:hypothetical protein